MLSHTQIQNAVRALANYYDFKKVSYFGSYADGQQTDRSDLDILVEFQTPSVSLLTLSDIKNRLEDELNISVDIIHEPIPKESFIKIEKAVTVYER